MLYFCDDMGVAQKIRNRIDKFEDGETFTYAQLSIASKDYIAAAKAIERMIDRELIKRVSTGIFYKPKKTIFGELKPNEEEQLKPYLFEDGKRIAYVTGILLYNQLGLTTQVPSRIKIASRDKRISISRGALKASPVKSYVDVTDKNYYVLGLLDALKDFNKILDINKNSGIKRLTQLLKELDTKEIALLVKSALAYPPRARAFLGALLEALDLTDNTIPLKESLNPLSSYRFEIEEFLPTAKNWNIA